MKNETRNNMERILHSMQGHKLAVPDPALFDKITNSIGQSERPVTMISRRMWSYMAAAAVVWMVVNTVAFNYMRSDEWKTTISNNQQEMSSQGLISDYKIYE